MNVTDLRKFITTDQPLRGGGWGRRLSPTGALVRRGFGGQRPPIRVLQQTMTFRLSQYHST